MSGSYTDTNADANADTNANTDTDSDGNPDSNAEPNTVCRRKRAEGSRFGGEHRDRTDYKSILEVYLDEFWIVDL